MVLPPVMRPTLRRLATPLASLEPPLVHPWGLLAVMLRVPSRLLDRLTAAHHRYLDHVTARVTQNPVLFPHGFFCDGWGDLSTPSRLHQVLQSKRMGEINPLRESDIAWAAPRTFTKARACVREAKFKSTLPNAREFLPEASLDAFCELVTPLEWQERPANAPAVDNKTLVGTFF
jgi:hypothetical protein